MDITNYYEMYKVDVPEGVIGDWSIQKFEVSKESADSFNLRQAINPHRGFRVIYPGVYTKLVHSNEIVMSDTPAEIEDFLPFLRRAEGNVLLNGLGLGCLLQALLRKDDVEHVTVIEKSTEVINLVYEHYLDKYSAYNFHVINDDALTYKFDKHETFDCVFHDIWNDICDDNLEEMKTLHRKYGRKCHHQESWCRHLMERK